MHLIVAALILLCLVVGPGLWVKRVMARYSAPEDRYPVSGGELARRLLDDLGLQHVQTEATETGDHYDPKQRVVRLSNGNFGGRSLTAVTVAAHEVGHALQHARGYAPLMWRTRLVEWVGPVEKLGAGLMMAAPLLVGVTRVPASGLLSLLGGVLALGAGAVIHLVTLPTEYDASFGRALPLLRERRVLRPEDEPHARRLLKAAAFTYVSASLLSLINVARWWAILRR